MRFAFWFPITLRISTGVGRTKWAKFRFSIVEFSRVRLHQPRNSCEVPFMLHFRMQIIGFRWIRTLRFSERHCNSCSAISDQFVQYTIRFSAIRAWVHIEPNLIQELSQIRKTSSDSKYRKVFSVAVKSGSLKGPETINFRDAIFYIVFVLKIIQTSSLKNIFQNDHVGRFVFRWHVLKKCCLWTF